MAVFPVRKLYQAAKVTLLVVLVVAILTMFEQWRGGKRSAGAMFSDPVEAEFERQIQEDELRIIPGLGEGGAAAHLLGEEKKLGEESEKKLAINVYLSDRIAYNRTLKDYRNPSCKRVIYDAELPSASVILIFHNEPYSVVVRTLWSVINSARRSQPWFSQANFVDRQTGKTMKIGYPNQDPESPFVYLKEIILVDDNSTLPELKGKLSHYIRTRLPPDLIRILRLPERVGLIRARLAGAEYAVGDTLIYLDTHCEVQPDWLRPLLQAIKDRPHAAVVPIIDVIEASSFYYSVLDATSFQVGGFNFNGHFTWTDVPEREKKRRGSDIAPTWSPTMAGGLFAINRNYFFELGGYDEQMGGWGGENLEMSFRIWQCGGTLETIPCSRVGHVFRSFHPYGLPAHSDTHGINTARMAEVWMDEYAELFYLHRPDLRNNPKIGDVTHRKVLREKLRCKSFQWYLDNIYKEKFIPVRDVYGYGRFKNPATNMCLDTLQHDGDNSPLGIYPCHSELQATQYFSFSSQGELRDETECATVQLSRSSIEDRGTSVVRPVIMSTCHGKGRGQKWRRLSTGQLQHVPTKLCLQASKDIGEVKAAVCTLTDLGPQVWEIDYTEDNNFHAANDLGGGVEREIRLRRLRGKHSRISRSLLSYSESDNHVEPRKEEGAGERARRRHNKGKHHRHHAHKRSRSKKHVKNKFILKLLRTLMNGTEEHLEVDIHCKHRQLYPNNSFVRDLVTMLNDKNVKVINNGRIFEHNKVTEIDAHKEEKVLNKMDIDMPPPIVREGQTKPRIKKRKRIDEVNNVIYKEPSSPFGEITSRIREGSAVDHIGGGTPEDLTNKIIVEEFVNAGRLTPSTPVAKRPHKRKHRRPHTHTPAHTDPSTKESTEMERDDSVEEVPVAEDSQQKEAWFRDGDYFRRSDVSHQHSAVQRQPQEQAEERFEPVYRSNSTVAPVKVVMKSNLTFKLGDDFFKWEHRATDDLVNEFLGELTIPSNSSERHDSLSDGRHDAQSDGRHDAQSDGRHDAQADAQTHDARHEHAQAERMHSDSADRMSSSESGSSEEDSN